MAARSCLSTCHSRIQHGRAERVQRMGRASDACWRWHSLDSAIALNGSHERAGILVQALYALQKGFSTTEKAKEAAEGLKEKAEQAAERSAEGLKAAAGIIQPWRMFSRLSQRVNVSAAAAASSCNCSARHYGYTAAVHLLSSICQACINTTR